MATKVPEDVLSSLEVSKLRVLHKPANDSHSMCDVGAGFCEKQEFPNEGAVEGSIDRGSG